MPRVAMARPCLCLPRWTIVAKSTTIPDSRMKIDARWDIAFPASSPAPETQERQALATARASTRTVSGSPRSAASTSSIRAPGPCAVTAAHVTRLEQAVEDINSGLSPLKEFILPGGTRPAALAHVARTVCRRAERAVVALARDEKVSQDGRVYLNRLSDLLFVIARQLNRASGVPDVLWQKGHSRGTLAR